MCKKFNYSFTVSCKSFNVLKEIINNGYPAYFNFPISDWESLDNLLLIGVSDVWIDGALGFNLKSVKSKCGNVNIRVSPQISANASLSPKFKSNANSFFIRPEDVTTYEPYIDYFDFAVDSFAEKTLYDIYKRQYFHQDLSKLIVHLNTKANNSLIPLKFVERRLNCKQLCLTGESRCTHCDLILKMSN